MNAHHGRAQPHAGNFGDERALVFAGIVRDIGRGAAHVEADDPVETREARHLHCADNAAGRARKDRVLSLEAASIGESARRLHELQPHARQFGFDLRNVAPENRRQVGIDDCRVAAGHQLHQRTDLVADRNLRKADAARKLGEFSLVLGIAVAMHEHDRACADAGGVRIAQIAFGGGEVERKDHVPMRADAFVDLDHAFIDQTRQYDIAHKQFWPILVRDAQRVAKSAGDDQCRALAPSLEQCVSRHRRSHLHGVDYRARNRCVRRQAEQFPNAVHCGVAVALGIFGQQLVRDQASVRSAGDDVGERAAAVDPELPAGSG